MKKGAKMSEQLSNEIKNVMEQTNQTLAEQIERSNQALQNMGNSINNNSGGRDISSNHSKNNGAIPSQIPKPPFLPREGTLIEEEE